MKARIVIAAFLVVIAVALPVVAVAGKGVPWGYRGHQAVLLEATGNVEVSLSDARISREQREDGAAAAEPGLFLDAGDELRVGRYAEARVRLPAGDLRLGDDARVAIGDRGVSLVRGLLEVEVPPGTTPFHVDVPGLQARVTLRPGGDGGSARLLTDGKGEVRVFVKSGSAEGSATGEASAETGKILVIPLDVQPRVEDPPAFAPSATCSGKKLTATAPKGTQIFAGRALRYAEDDKVIVELKEQKPAVPVFARDVAGQVWFASVPCGGRSK